MAATAISLHRLISDASYRSTYDDQMMEVVDMVRAKHAPSDPESQGIVLDYYITRLQSYWRKLREYIFGNPATPDLPPLVEVELQETPFAGFSQTSTRNFLDFLNTGKRDLTPVRANFVATEPRFREKLSQLTTEFGISKRFDLLVVWQLFEYIGKLFCLATSVIDAPTVFKRHEYPLPNESGLFGLNTYLYAYFEGVLLVGIPTSVQTFDLRTECVHHFMEHDHGHNYELDVGLSLRTPRSIFSKQKLKTAYQQLLNAPALGARDKEFAIMHLWCAIHEFERGFVITSAPQRFLTIILESGVVTLVISFIHEYRRFADLIFPSSSLVQLSTAFQKYGKDALSDMYVNTVLHEKLVQKKEETKETAYDINKYSVLYGKSRDDQEEEEEPKQSLTTLVSDIQTIIDTQKEGANVVANTVAWYIMAHWVARICSFIQLVY